MVIKPLYKQWSPLRQEPEAPKIIRDLPRTTAHHPRQEPGDCKSRDSSGSLPAFILFLLSLPAFFLIPYHHINAASLPEARVIAVNDGDTVTIVMKNREYRTRLIGLDAPEMGQEPWGEKAREHLRKLLKENHWRVSVETGIEEYDKYNRLLVYLWTRDGEMLNERMLRDGYAVLFTIQPNSKYVDRFVKAQRIARQKKSGIWGPDGLKERPLDYKKAHPRQ